LHLVEKVEQYASLGWMPAKEKPFFLQFYHEYVGALQKDGVDPAPHLQIFDAFLERCKELVLSPYTFSPYHKQVREPFDYYQFGLDFFRPLIDFPHSSVEGHDVLRGIANDLKRGENVIFLANHQIEADPQVLSLLLEKEYPALATEMIFVAGERVTTDLLAVPFSLGRNLLCIYSKRHIDHPPEQKTRKQLHNQKTMELMSELLSEGGHAIYVAPSGGRDRADAKGVVHVAPFDPQSIEMFHLMTKKAKKPTSFYPMALSTYAILPPPKDVQKELGEERKTGRGAVHLFVGPKISMDTFPGAEHGDKREKRQKRAECIWDQVNQAYERFSKHPPS